MAAYPPFSLSLPMPCVMGIVNVTPDSFSDGGLLRSTDAAVACALDLASQGAAIVDIGGESTRPGSDPVSADEELRRALPVVERVAAAGVMVSVDTMKAAVARRVLAAGAVMINDVSAARFDPDMVGLLADSDCAVCLMHMLGEPKTMQDDPRYDDVVSEVAAFLEERLRFVVDHGVAEERVVLDPGIGFGKTVEHNLQLLRGLPQIVALGRPVVLGASRKRFLAAIAGGEPLRRLGSTVATTVLAAQLGVTIFRVHDVEPNVQALCVLAAVADRGDTARGVTRSDDDGS